MEADGPVRGARPPGLEHRRVRGHRVRRPVRVHAGPAPDQGLPAAAQAHRRLLRRVARLHRRVRAVLRQLVARHLGGHGRAHRRPAARRRRHRGPGHRVPGVHEDAAQHHRAAHSHTDRQLRRVLRGAHAVPHRSPSETRLNAPSTRPPAIPRSHPRPRDRRQTSGRVPDGLRTRRGPYFHAFFFFFFNNKNDRKK